MDSSNTQQVESSTTESQNLQRQDSMPDLIWPEKKKKTVESNNITPSVSNDTGFNTDSASSPNDEEVSISDVPDLPNDAEGTSSGVTADEAGVNEERDMDILGNSLLVKKVLVAGNGMETRPQNGDYVTLKVDGVLEDGTHIDTDEITFILNDGDVIIAFDLAVALMEMGEKCELKTAPRYAYGEKGREPDIPKDATIIYTLEIVNIAKAPEPSQMSFDERRSFGEAKRERGNYLYSRGDFTGAISSYGKATKLLDDPEMNASLSEEDRTSLSDTWVKCYNNMAACQLKIEALDAAIRSCERVIATQEDNVKALFRLGKAHGAKGNVDIAISYLGKAIKLEPESKMLHQEMLKLSRRKSKETATEKELYQRMLGVKPGDNSIGTKKESGTSNPLMRWAAVGGVLAVTLTSIWAWSRSL